MVMFHQQCDGPDTMLKTRLNRFATDQRGTVAVIIALSAIPLISMTALAVDISIGYRKQTALQAALDSTALQLAHRSVMNPHMDSQQLIAAGKSMVAVKIDGDVNYSQFHIDTDGVEVRIEASTDYKPTFAQVMGFDNMTIGASARAIYGRAEIDFYVMIDNSPSMGIGATTDAIEQLENTVGCAFACHSKSPQWDNSQAVRAQNVEIRIDAAASAIGQMADRFERERTYASQFRLAAYTFGNQLGPSKPRELTPLTDNLTSIRGLATAIELMEHVNGFEWAGTDYAENMTFVREKIETDRADPRNANRSPVLFIITDGVNHSPVTGTCFGIGNSDDCVSPMDEAYCDAIKDMDVTIAVLHTLYLPIPSEQKWVDYVKPQQDELDDAIEDCASPGYYFPVDFKSGAIDDAMEKAFEKTVRGMRLTSPNNSLPNG
jgi:hypothetical protein